MKLHSLSSLLATALVWQYTLAWMPPTTTTVTLRPRTNLLSTTVSANKDDFSVDYDDDDDKDSYAYIPPEFEVIDAGNDDDQTTGRRSTSLSSGLPEAKLTENNNKPQESPWESDYEEDQEASPRKKSTIKRPKRPSMGARASWMERNAEFSPEHEVTMEPEKETPNVPFHSQSRFGDRANHRNSNQSFRQDFRGTRVFATGIPPDVSWQDFKDHFKIAGTVVFASVSIDPKTGKSKGRGIVQYETTEMAQTAIAIMRNYPLNGSTLFVREDVQEAKENAVLKNREPRQSRVKSAPPPKWCCADEENASYLSEEDKAMVVSLIKARDDARRKRQYDVSDKMRDELKNAYGVHLDDRLKMWWTSMDGKKVPRVLREIKGEGRWGLNPWRQIPTTPENDACVSPDLVTALLNQRDIARREKDFSTADALLEEARTSPDGDLNLRIHDESRTWRIWTEAPPPRPVSHTRQNLSPKEQCLAIVEEFNPDKADEVRLMLDKFPGREWQILKKVRQRYIKD